MRKLTDLMAEGIKTFGFEDSIEHYLAEAISDLGCHTIDTYIGCANILNHEQDNQYLALHDHLDALLSNLDVAVNFTDTSINISITGNPKARLQGFFKKLKKAITAKELSS